MLFRRHLLQDKFHLMRTAAYCRFSSDQQREASIRDQLRNIESYCDRAGWPRPALYQDQAASGSRNDRPGYQMLLEAAKAGAFDVLLVDDYSRLSRDHIEGAQTLRLLRFLKIRIVGVSDGLDSARGDAFKLEAGVRGLMSELYLDDLAKKTHRGLMGQALEGFSAGGTAYGYRSERVGDGFRRFIVEDEARWVRHIFERYAHGVSPRAIADELNRARVPSPRGSTWAHSALYPDSKGVGMLGNPIYIGRQVWNRTQWVKDPESGRRRRLLRPKEEWVIVEQPELAIVSQEIWEAAEARTRGTRGQTARRQATTGKGAGGRPSKYLFSGLLRCGVCGGSYVVIDRYRYGCATHKDRGTSVCANSLKVARSTVEEVLLADIKATMLSEEAYQAFEREVRVLLKQSRPDPAAARRLVSDAKREVDNLLAAIRAGIITASTKAAMESAEQVLAERQAELVAIERFEPTQVLPRAREIYRDLVASLANIEDVESARVAVQALVGEVRLLPEDGKLVAEMTNAGLAGVCQITLVAGTGFEPVTFGL